MISGSPFETIFGDGSESILEVERRAQKAFGSGVCVVWEGDPSTFQFLYVSPCAEEILGYPARAWLEEPAFWAETVVHPEDRRDAIAYCALATGKGRDHDFVYRAVKANGGVVWLHDVVKVFLGPKGVPRRLRGLMFAVADKSKVAPVFEVVGGSEAAA